MNLFKKAFVVSTMILSLNAFSQDYEFAVLKSGVKQDLETLIGNANNFVSETDHNSNNNISYLKYTSNIAKIFKKYGVSNNISHDSDNISSLDELISVGESFDTYYQCVQFIRAISDADGTDKWKWSGAYLNQNMYLNWRIVAKFKSDGTYWQSGDPTPYGHVALVIASNSNGIYVIDQNWEGDGTLDYGKVAIHLIPWDEADEYALLTQLSN
jgi:hypothetical protein